MCNERQFCCMTSGNGGDISAKEEGGFENRDVGSSTCVRYRGKYKLNSTGLITTHYDDVLAFFNQADLKTCSHNLRC